jgi:hypothetical protein
VESIEKPFLTLSAAVSASVSGTTASTTLPASPSVGDIYKYIGNGVAWTFTANTGQYIRLLATESTSAGTIVAGSLYDCVSLEYVGDIGGHNTWLVEHHVGTPTIT